jgi:ParB family chromosome partitioning protein
MSRDIFLNQIDPDPDQPRKYFDEGSLKELAQSIKASGLAAPILLRPNGERFMIVHGERRYRAVTILGWESIPAEVRDIDREGAKWLALAENVQRSDLRPIEEALAYQARLAEGLTQGQLGQRIGKTQSYIATKLRLLKLPQPVQAELNTKTISEGHAKQLLRLESESSQLFALQTILQNGLSVAEAKEAVDKISYCDELFKQVKGGIEQALINFDEIRDALLEAKAVLTEEQHRSWVEAQNGPNISYSLALRIEQATSQTDKLDLMCDMVEELALRN